MQSKTISSNSLEFMMIVSDEGIAQYISKFENVSLFVDLETLGKEQRQGHLDTVRSSLNIDDVLRIRRAAPQANIIVRINPLNSATENEINSVIKNGANSIMLPMFHTIDDINKLIKIINNRATAIPLFETVSSIKNLPEIISKIPLQQLHIGLNDLHIEHNMNFLFEPLANGFLEEACHYLKLSRIKYGIGGIAALGQGLLGPEYILGEHVRLGSSVVILSRAFHKNSTNLDELKKVMNFSSEIRKLIKIYENFQMASVEQIENNRKETWKLIKILSERLKNDK